MAPVIKMSPSTPGTSRGTYLKRHRRQRGQLPQQHAQAPDVAGGGVKLLLQRFQRHPLDRPVLVVAEAVVIGRKDVTRQRVITDTYVLLRVEPTKEEEERRRRRKKMKN